MRTLLIDLVVAVGMLVIVPLELSLIPEPGLAPMRRLWPTAAAPGVNALGLHRGGPATAL